MEKTTITVAKDTQKDLMIFKIRSNAKNLDEVIKLAIKKLKEVPQVETTQTKKNSSPVALHSKEKENEK